ncbi:aldolase [Terriglobus saanensis]|nr:aldolase [Terriglobus saanensis]
MELPLRGVFYPLGFAVEILTNDPEVLRAADESFGHVHENRGATTLQIRIGISEGANRACPPEPTRREYNHLYSLVADVENQALLDLKTCTSFAWLKKSTLKNRLYFRYNFLEKMVYLLLGASVVTDLHAACVGKEGKGILLCGDSGAGKSTLAYACARAGWTYTSDDTSYLINQSEAPRVIGHAHRVRFRPAARELFPELAAHAVTPRMEGKPSIEVPVSELPVLRSASEAKVYAIVYLNRYPSATGSLMSLPKGTAIQRMCNELFSAGDIRAQHEAILQQAFADVPTYEIEYSDSEQAIHQLDLLITRT